MGNDRIIKVIGAIDAVAFRDFSESLTELESESIKDIRLELTSDGGESYVGLAFYSKMIESKCKFNVRVYGNVMSAATAILAGGNKRTMMCDAWYMVHDDSQRIKAENNMVAIAQAAHNEALERHWARILARNSKPTPQEWRKMSKRTTYLTARECLDLGIIDEIY